MIRSEILTRRIECEKTFLKHKRKQISNQKIIVSLSYKNELKIHFTLGESAKFLIV